MPRPLPEWVPPPVGEVIVSEYGDLKGLARGLGLPYTTVVNGLRANEHRSLVAFNDAAARIGVEPDALVPILDLAPPKRKGFLEKILRTSIGNIKDISVEGESDNYLYSLLLGRVGNPIRRFYSPVCRALRMSLVELEVMLGAK